MLLKDFYKITSREASSDNKLHTIGIVVNKNHDIFKGHFPNNPILPGVCMMQIIKEISEDITGIKLFMNRCSNVKFKAIINPDINSELTLNLTILEENQCVIVKNSTQFGDTIALILTAYYQKKH